MRALLVAFALAAASCRAQAQTEPLKVRVAYVPVIGAAPLFVLAGAGWAGEAGLAVVPVRFESGPPAIGALASGTIDALAIGVAPVAVARAKGLDVKVVGAMSSGGSGLVAGADLAQALSRETDVGKAFAAWRAAHGRSARLATLPPGGVPAVALSHWLFALNKVAREDVQIVAMGIDAVQQAVLTGGVDGGTVLEPSLTLVLGRDSRLKLVATANDMFAGAPGVVLAVSGAFAKAHPDAVEALVALNKRAIDYIPGHIDEAAAFVQPIFGGGLVDRGVLAQALGSKTLGLVADPRAIQEPTGRLLDYQVEIGDFAQPPSLQGLFDSGPYGRATAPK